MGKYASKKALNKLDLSLSVETIEPSDFSEYRQLAETSSEN